MTTSRLLRLAVGLAALAPFLRAQSVWVGTQSTFWSDAGNWANEIVPANSSAGAATLSGATNTAIAVDSPWTLGTLTFDASAGNFILSGSQLTIATTLHVLSGAQMLQNPLHLNSSATVNVKSGASLTLAGGGTGMLDFNPLADPDGANDASYGGTLTLSGATSFHTIYASGGLLQVDAATAAGQLSLIGGATVELNTGGAVNDALIALMQNSTLKLNADQAFTDSAVWFYALGDGPGGTIDLNGHQATINAMLSFNYGGTAAESGWIVNSATGEATVTFDLFGAHVFAGNTSNHGAGALHVVKEGSGVLVFGTARNDEWAEPGSSLAHTGSTTVNGGTLIVNGTLTSSAVTVNAGGTLAGIGELGEVLVASGGTITAQDYGAVGTMTVGNLTLEAGATLAFHLTDAAGGAGTGWTLIEVNDMLSLSATAGSLTLSIAAGDFDESNVPLNFNPAGNYSFTIARFGTLSGFTPSVFALLGGDSGVFAGGTWTVAQSGSELHLNYTAIPEPATYAALAGLLVLGVALRRRRG